MFHRYEARRKEQRLLIMEKINYTEYRINSDPEESEFFLIERTVEDGVFTEGVKLSSPYKEEIEKIVTLYDLLTPYE